MINGFPFIRGMVNGTHNTIYWRCAQAKKFKCLARVKTRGKMVQSNNLVHNHEPKNEKSYSAIVWKEIQ